MPRKWESGKPGEVLVIWKYISHNKQPALIKEKRSILI